MKSVDGQSRALVKNALDAFSLSDDTAEGVISLADKTFNVQLVHEVELDAMAWRKGSVT